MEIIEHGLMFEVESARCVLKKLVQSASSIEIPRFIKGKPVEVIDEGAFRFCTGVNKVTLPATLLKIRAFAFEEADVGIIERRIDDKSPVLFVDRFAFAGSKVQSVTFGGATFLDASGYQFRNCRNLRYVDSKNIRGRIPMGAFENCGISYFVFSDNCTIAFNAFFKTDLDMVLITGELTNTSNFFPTHKSAKIICKSDNPILFLAYDGYDVAINTKEDSA